MDRRRFMTALGAMLLVPRVGSSTARREASGRLEERLAELERRVGGRLGVVAAWSAPDGSRATIAHRADERFPLCSTFKWMLAAQVLHRVDQGLESLDALVPFTERDLLEYAPVTRAHLAEGALPVRTLCEAIVTVSDNPAANLLLARVGGPAGHTAWLRGLGDRVTRLDRTEPALNEATPGDPRDTTTPSAQVDALQRLLLGETLREASRAQLTRWMEATTTGAARLRAGFPAAWRAGDKTGTGNRGTTNDVAIAWPVAGGALLVAAYLTESEAPLADRQAVLAEVGRLAATLPG